MPTVLAALAALQFAAVPPDTVHLVIAATTDVHGQVLGWDYVRDREAPFGLSRAATILETLRARYPDGVVVLDAGDLLQGNAFATYFGSVAPQRPHPVVDALNALGYDAATPGNHDFDFGSALLREGAVDAAFRYISGNVRWAAAAIEGGGDSLLFPAHILLPRGGVRVGITGFTTPGVNVWDRVQLEAGGIHVDPIVARAPAVLRGVRDAGADFVVAIVHSGLGGGSSYDTAGVGAENEAGALAFIEPKPDLVIVGHSHREIRDSVINGVHFVQPRNGARSVSVTYVTLVRRTDGRPPRGYRVTELRADLIPLASVAESPRLARRLGAAHELVRSWAAQPIGTAGAGFSARYARAQDTPLLDFINAVQRRRTGADLAATAAFDVTGGLPPGGVRLRDVQGVYPYENTLRAVRLSGAQLKAYLEHASRYYTTWGAGGLIDPAVPGYDFDVVSGADYTIDLARPVGERIQGLAVNGRPVTPRDSFTLALNSYRQEGGGGYTMLRGARVTYDRGESVRDVLVEEIRRLGTLDSAAVFALNWALTPAAAREAARRAFAPIAPPVSTADSTLLRVLALADFHGALEARSSPWSGGRAVGGAAALKRWLDSLDRDCGCSVIRLDAGDEMQGTPLSNFTNGRATIETLNRLGIDAAAIGNHEFDWTVDTLRARIADARYPFVSANITDTAGARPAWAEPWTIVSRGTVKVAVIGLTTTSTPTTARPSYVRALRFGDLAEAVRAVLPRARAAADFVVVLAHEGGGCDSTGCRGEIIDFARRLDSGSVDLIVAGHLHRRVNTVVNGIPVVQAGSSGNTIALVDFVRVGGTGREVRARLIDPFTDQVTPDTALARYVDSLARRLDSVTTQPVATLAAPLRRDGPEYALGNLIADAQRSAVRADVAVMNNGGIRADLPAGPVVWGQLFTVQPFRNRLMRMRVTGTQLLEVLEHVVSSERPHAHVSGVEIWYDGRRPPGRRITRTRLLDGRAIAYDGRYTLAVSDFLAEGGDGFAILAALPAEDAGVEDLSALIRYLSLVRQPVALPAGVRLHRGGG